MRTSLTCSLALLLCACTHGGSSADLGDLGAPADLAVDLRSPPDLSARDLPPPPDLYLPPAVGALQWGRSFAGATINDVAVALDGSLYLAGSFNVADLGDGPVTASGPSDVFLVKLDKLGQRLWARTFGRAFIDGANRLTVDKDGNAAVVGYSLRTADPGTHDAFVAVYSPSGAQRYLRYYGGPLVTAVDVATSAGYAADGSLWVAGGFEDHIDLGGGDVVSVGSRDVFLLHLSDTGAYLASRRYGSPGYDQATGLAVLPDGDLALTGAGGYPLELGDGNPGNDSTVDTFLARLDPAAAARWSKRFRISPFATSLVASAADGTIWFLGDQNRAVDYGGGPRGPAVGRSIFWAHYGPTGAHLSSAALGSTTTVYLNRAAVDSKGQLVAGGRADGDIDFGAGLTTRSDGQAFFFKAAEAQVRWSRRFGGTNGDDVRGLAVLAGDQIAVGVTLSRTVTLDDITTPAGGAVLVFSP